MDTAPGRGMALAGLLSVFIGLAGCGWLPTTCPSTFDEANATAENLGEDPFIATGTVVRYVDSPDLDQRGYDIAVARHEGPVFVDVVVFLRVAEPLPGMDQGQPVLVIGERTDRRNVIVPGSCPPLQPIDDAGVPGGG